MSELYSQKEISEMLKELQIEKEKAQNMTEAYYRMNALNYDLNLQIQTLRVELEKNSKALEYLDTLLFDHCFHDSQECFIRCDHEFDRCACLKKGMWAELALQRASEEV